MPDQEQKVCDGCHERPATLHSTTCTGESTTTRDLCMICWEQLASPEELASQKRFQEVIRNGKCKYCGQPAAGGSFSGGFTTMQEQVNLWCELCQADYSEFMSRPENVLPDDFPDDEAVMQQHHERLTVVMATADEYVRKRVAERKA